MRKIVLPGGHELAAEFQVHSLLAGGQNVFVRDYLVVDVYLTPASKAEPLAVSYGQFQLRLDSKRATLPAQAPELVAASLKYEDWERRPTLVAGGGVGNGGVLIGRPQRTERFPGDQRPRQERLPGPVPRAPEPVDRSGMEREPAVAPWETAVRAALPSVDARQPVTGALYFAFQGKAQKIRKVELLYSGPGGEATLVLAP